MKKSLVMLIAALSLTALLAGCGSSSSGSAAALQDGTYTAESTVYENDDGSTDGNGYGVVTLTIENGAIADCTYETYEVDGTVKGEDYGKQNGEIANRDYYNKAQKAVAACDEYASELVQNGQLDGIDAITGATINYDHFVEAVNAALEQAEAGE